MNTFTKKKYIVILLVVLITCTAFLCTSFLCVSLSHECIGEGCSVCAQIQKVENLSKNITCLANAVNLIFAITLFSCIFLYKRLKHFVRESLVGLKIKLSN